MQPMPGLQRARLLGTPMQRGDGVPERLPVAVALSVRDGMRTMPRVLDSVMPWSSRVLVFDTGSSDGTVEYCRSRGCEVIACEWAGFSGERARCLEACSSSPWILLLDADEIVEPDLMRSIRDAVIRDDPRVDGYSVRRMVHFEGGMLRHTFQPEYRLRLVRGGKAAAFGSGDTGQGSHDRIEIPGRVDRLDGILRHESWADLNDFWTRSPRYCQAAARFGESGGRVVDVLVRPAIVFLKQYVLKRGFLDGRRGFLMAAMMATGNSMKQITLLRKRWSRQLDATIDR